MSSLYDEKNISIIPEVDNELDWDSIVINLFTNDNPQNRFCINSELIDIDDRFRIAKIKEKLYIIKKTSNVKAHTEIINANKLNELIGNRTINGYTIKIVIPNYVEIGNNTYLISEYMGYTLQESLYDSRKSKVLPFIYFKEIIKLLFDNGIIYRGFIPRNIIISGSYLNLIDFEDIIISTDSIRIDLLFITNFILNWQYFYDIYRLYQLLENLNLKLEDTNELLKYEQRYQIITGIPDNASLREHIKNTVVNGEKPTICKNQNDYEIMPNDLAHLISDLFNYEVDVIFDLLSYHVRCTNEVAYYKYLKLFSRIIYLEKNNKMTLQYYFIILISMLLESVLTNNDILEIQNNEAFYDRFNEYIKASNFKVAKAILDNNIKQFKDELNELIITFLTMLFGNNEDYSLIINPILCISEEIIKKVRCKNEL